MNGPEHFREAEKRLQASDWQWQQAGEQNDDALAQGALREAAMAQAHATLALAAATAMAAYGATGMHYVDFNAWDQAAGVAPPGDEPQRSKGNPL